MLLAETTIYKEMPRQHPSRVIKNKCFLAFSLYLSFSLSVFFWNNLPAHDILCGAARAISSGFKIIIIIIIIIVVVLVRVKTWCAQ